MPGDTPGEMPPPHCFMTPFSSLRDGIARLQILPLRRMSRRQPTPHYAMMPPTRRHTAAAAMAAADERQHGFSAVADAAGCRRRLLPCRH